MLVNLYLYLYFMNADLVNSILALISTLQSILSLNIWGCELDWSSHCH